jgi:DNA-binding CsgD family transcriptional regulator/PAS domain-containing protein
MTREAELLDLVGDIYDCAIEPSMWPNAMERLARTLDFPAAVVSVQDPTQHRVQLFATWGITQAFTDDMMRGLAINPFFTAGWFLDVDEAYSTVRYLGRDAYYRTRFHREILAPHGFGDAAIVNISKTTMRFGGLTFPHRLDQGEISDVKLAEVRLVAPHVRRAVGIADILEAKSIGRTALESALDLLTVAIVLVDGQGRVVHRNKSATALLAAGTSLRIAGDLLSVADPKSAADLSAAISTAASLNSAERMSFAGIALPLAATDGSDLAAWVLPLDTGLRQELAAPFHAKVAVFVRALGDTSPFPGELFVKRFAITPAECRVLMLLTQGMTPAEAADCLGISLTTVKTHMARLFEKTGTSGQPDLMRLAMSALAPAAPSG